MKYKNLFFTLFLTVLSFQVQSQDEKMKLGVYVVVSNLDVSKKFYEEVFGTPAYFENSGFAGFSVSGNLFGIFLESSFTHDLARGNNLVPYIQVSDIEAEIVRIKDLAPEMVHSKVVVEGPIQLFMFKDPDGNVIEFFSFSN